MKNQSRPTKDNEQLWQPLPFSLSSFFFRLVAEEHIILPVYKGSTFRGGFGHALKYVWCMRPGGRVCKSCLDPAACAYSYIFETPKAFGRKSHLQAANLPHPFVLTPPLSSQNHYAPGEEFTFELTLFGSSIHVVETFIYAFEKLGEWGIGKGQGKFRLKSVTNATGGPVWQARPNWQGGEVQVINYDQFLKDDRSPEALRIEFLSPTRILYRDKLAREITFEIFIRNLLRRASSLAEIHCGEKWQLDYKHLIDLACNTVQMVESRLDWQDWERYSSRQERRMKLGGLVGTASYQGNIRPFLPLIRLGEYLHLGKNTSFGMGKYCLASNLTAA